MNLNALFQDNKLLGREIEHWIAAAVIFGSVMAISWLLRVFLVQRLRKFAAHTETRWDDCVLLLLEKTKPFLLGIVALHLALQPLGLSPKVDRASTYIFTFAAFLQIGLWANQALRFFGDNYASAALAQDAGRATTAKAVLFLGQIFLWALVFLLLLDNWGVNVSALVAGLGIGGIAIAFALQNILGDLFASVSIVMDKPFVIGDSIAVGEDSGTVENIGLKTTRLKRITGEQLIFSNSELLKSRIRNFKRMHDRRILFRIGVLYETEQAKLERVPAILKECVLAAGELRFDRAHFAAFANSWIEFELVYWVNSPDYTKHMDLQQKFAFRLVQRFREEGIEFAYPTQRTVVLEEASKA